MKQSAKNKLIYLYITMTALSVLAIWIFQRTGVMERTLAWIISGVLLAYIPVFCFIKSRSIRHLLLVLALSTGGYGFFRYSDDPHTFADSLYSTFRLFKLTLDNVFNGRGHVPLAVEIARWSAAAYTIFTLISLFFRFFDRNIKLLWYKIARSHTVIAGFNTHSKLLIESLAEQDNKIVLLTETILKEERQELEKLGVIVLKGSPDKKHELYKRCSPYAAKYFIIFHQDDTSNLNETVALHSYIKGRMKHVQVVLHLNHRQSNVLLESLEKSWNEENGYNRVKKLQLRSMNVHYLLAEKLLNDYPLYEGYEDRLRDPSSEALHLLFVGFGQTGQHIAIQALERAHFLHRKRLRITVLDKDADKIRKQWYRNYPKSDKVAELAFHPFNVHVEAVEQWIEASNHSYTHVYIGLNEDYTHLTEGIHISKKYPKLSVYIKMSNEGCISDWIHSSEVEYGKIRRFGNVRDVLNKKYFMNDTFEQAAKTVNDKYRQHKLAHLKPEEKAPPLWEKLSQHKQQSNRNQLNHLRTKLMLLELEAIPKSAPLEDEYVELTWELFKGIVDPIIESLAIVEHERWNAFHFLKGYDVLVEATKDYPQDEKRKLHCCLVPWEELYIAEEKVGEPYRQYDINTIYDLYVTAQRLELRIVRRVRKEASA